MRSARHALSAAALTAVALGGLSACDGFDIAAVQAAARTPTSTVNAAPRSTAAASPAALASLPGASTTPASTSAPKTSTPAPTASATAKPADTSVAGQLLKIVNAERSKAGCRTVALDTRLTAAAAGHARDMAAANYFSHTSKDGRTFVDRIEEQGYSAPRSENIAAGQPSVTAVMKAWMKSAGHRGNILDCSATQMGAASAKGGSYGVYWVQDFGRG